MTIARALSLSLLAVAVSCRTLVGPGWGTHSPVDQTIQLRVGATRTVGDGLEIRFAELVHESRCPSDAVCIRAGEAAIELQLERRGREVRVRAVMPGTVVRVDSTRAESIRAFGHTIQLLQLDPYPGLNVRIDPGSYVAHLRVRRRS